MAMNYIAGNGPMVLVVGDFNGDSAADLASANQDDVSVLTAAPGTRIGRVLLYSSKA